MDFQTFASTETRTLVDRLLARHAAPSLQQLQALREAVDAAARSLEAPVHAEQDVHELAARLTGAAEAEVRRIRDEAQAALEAARRDSQALSGEIDKLRATIAQADAEAAILKSELQTAIERAESTERDLGLTIDAHEAVEAALHDAERASRDAAQAQAAIEQAKTALDTELADARAAIELMLVEAEQLRARADRDAAEKAAFESELARARTNGDERDALATRLATATSRVQVLEGDLVGAHSRIQAVEGDFAAAHSRVKALEGDLAAAHSHVKALEGELAGAHETRQQRDVLGAELETARARVDALGQELAAARAAGQDREAVAAQLQASATRIHTLERDLTALTETRQQRDAAVRELELSQERLQQLEVAQERQQAKMQDLQTRLDAARSDAARASDGGATAAAAEEAETLRGEVDRMVSLFDASARAVTEMAAAATSGELLHELVKRLSLQFSRVALFRVKGNRLEGEHQIGFDDDADVTKVVIPTTVDSMLTRTISSGVVQSMTGDDVAVRSGTPFGGTPRSAVALPVVLQGTTLAVVYADDSDMPESARGPAVHESSVGFARMLVGQVVVLLVRHTHELKTLAELSQYATTLLQEAKEMYLADAQAGKNADLLRTRLKANIDCASQLFTYRAAMEGTAAASLLDDQIALEMEGTSAFARDLATVVHDMAATGLQLTAEAS